MRFCLLCGGAAALAANSSALGALINDFRLDWGFVARSGTAGTTIADITNPVTIQSGEKVRIELRYRIHDLVSDTTGSRGLANAIVNIINNVGAPSGNAQRANITNAQYDRASQGDLMGAAPRNPDSSGDSTFTGLCDPFRSGSQFDWSFANGRINDTGQGGVSILTSGFEISPLALSAPDQRSWNGGGMNPTTSNTNASSVFWAVYTFEYIAAANFVGSITFSTVTEADGATGAKFGYYRRQGTTNFSQPDTSIHANEASITINVVPVPGAAAIALAGLGLGMTARRRRIG